LNALVGGLVAERDAMQVAKDKFASIDPSNPREAVAAVQDIQASNDKAETEQDKAAEAMQTNKDMEQAIDAAPNRQKLDDERSTTTGTATTTS